MKKRNLLLVILAVLLVFGMVVGCGPADDEDGTTKPGGGGTTATAVTYSVTANGSATTVATTQLTLTFDKDIEGLTPGNIAVTGLNVIKGNLSGSGKSYTLGVNCSKSGSLSVTVTAPSGYSITTANATKTVTVFDPFDKYYLDFRCSYKANVTETILLTKNLITFYDNERSVSNPDKIVFTVDSWVTEPTIPQKVNSLYTGNAVTDTHYTKGVKITGKITDARPPDDASAATTTQVYGGLTCPGITKADIGQATLYIYLYFTEEDDLLDTYLVRSAFFGKATNAENPMETSKREYRVIELD